MARGMSEARRRDAALAAGRRMIARGERPLHRLRPARDGRWRVDAMPWVTVAATGRREALDEARAAIAGWLEVDAETFDVEAIPNAIEGVPCRRDVTGHSDGV